MINKLGLVNILYIYIYINNFSGITNIISTDFKTTQYIMFYLFQLSDNGTYNKTGTEDALKMYWSEWPLEKIKIINDKCYNEGEMV